MGIFMKTLILIDGNSLLNRAYYATRLLTTKDGTPTNAVFGFIKLLLKIISDQNPDKLIVTFDLKAPTFRHQLYDGYKATRKPMPDDLAVQVGMLKELLRTMRICICEKEGYEADDLVGTLSHRFADTHSIIITGDRDAYQLVDERTSVYLTKTGVSELLKLDAAHFEEMIGYKPCQVIDMKALMGDSSDNIPGVPGIGEKTALDLVRRFGSLDGVYAHLGDCSASVCKKLEAGKGSAYLSYKLAAIDRDVPIEIGEDAGALALPFSEEVKRQFLQLEFTSLAKLDIFAAEGAAAAEAVPRVAVRQIGTDCDFPAAKSCRGEIAAVEWQGCLHFYIGGVEYAVRERGDLLGEVDEARLAAFLKEVFEAEGAPVILYGKKAFRHLLRGYGVSLCRAAEDVSLMKYLADYSGKDDQLSEALQSGGLPEETPAYGVYCLYKKLSGQLQSENLTSLYQDLELPLCDVLYDMEVCGVRIDRATSAQFEQRYREKIAEITARIYEQAGETFNLNSPAQLGKILFEKLGLPASKKNKKGTYSTGAEILEKLAGKYAIVADVLECRHFQKLLSTYIDGFKPLIDRDGLVHTTFNQVQTSTGRLSSLNPNLQNIPVRDEEGRELRKLFVARGEGRVLIDADYSQIELRLLAHFSGCKELIEAYGAGKDIHALTASQVFGVPLDKVTPEQRRAAKAVNFGIIYGISDFGLASNLHIPTKQAGEYIRKYFETYSDVKEYMDANVAFAREHGYVTTLLGRKRFIPELRSSNYNIRAFGERAAMNMPLQGSSADIIKIAMIRVAARLREGKFRSQLILQVHDELIIDAFEEEKEQVAQMLQHEMENAVRLQVPLTVEVRCGKSWYETK